ncbi:testis-expressed protein 22 [Choloepus didactylus]|uniref:testis-expressed protein 22 n=1 Tax=Choloepus didactylus TaxID=27675 RepID=UPI00189C8C04|nr:testis-expressed protein 22 [Choloepus didactylus]
MDSRKRPSQAPRGTKAEPRLPQEHGLPPKPGRATAWGPPSAPGSGQQPPQTQDWVCEQQERGPPRRHWSLSIDDRRRLAVLGGLDRAVAPGASPTPTVRGGERGPSGLPAHPPAASPPAAPLTRRRPQDIAQGVWQLVSEGVDRDVLSPHPPRSAESTTAFHSFLARSAPLWQNSPMER